MTRYPMKSRWIRFLVHGVMGLLTLTIGLGCPPAGSGANVTGIVRDAVSGEPVPGASIRRTPYDYVEDTTNSDGVFVIGLEAGVYQITVSATGYETTDGIEFNASAGEVVRLPEIFLEPVFVFPMLRIINASTGTISDIGLVTEPQTLTLFDAIVPQIVASIVLPASIREGAELLFTGRLGQDPGIEFSWTGTGTPELWFVITDSEDGSNPVSVREVSLGEAQRLGFDKDSDSTHLVEFSPH